MHRHGILAANLWKKTARRRWHCKETDYRKESCYRADAEDTNETCYRAYAGDANGIESKRKHCYRACQCRVLHRRCHG